MSIGFRAISRAKLAGIILLCGSMLAQPAQAQPRTGLVGRNFAEAPPPTWPGQRTAPAGAPNIIVIMTDDVGYSASSTFGGAIPTPTLDALAREGLRYTQFNTAALCSPTRASLLTGRTPHNVGMGQVTNFPTGYPGYNTVIPDSSATIARVLRGNGYNTAMFGKGHITPEWETGPAGPFDRWPTGLGFEYFYGFLGPDVSMWAPAIVENTTPVDPPADDPDFHFEADMADRAIAWIREQHAAAPDKPFFIYYAPGTAHTPHHAPADWIDRFSGRFDEGWDELRRRTFERQQALGVIPANAQLTPRPASLAAWESLSADERRLAARLMEAYAGSLAFVDHQIGRVIEAIRQTGEFDNTIIIYIQGDNGGSGEGGPVGQIFSANSRDRFSDSTEYMLSRIDEIGSATAYNHHPAAWGWAMNTPFQWTKQVASHFGGIRNGMVVSWPRRIADRGATRGQFLHVADVFPTLLEAIGIDPPDEMDGVHQQPLDGLSFGYTFTGDPPTPARTQVFEVMQNLGIYHDGWWAGTTPGRQPWQVSSGVRVGVDGRQWELYNVAEDYSQARNLAEEEPEMLSRLQQLFWAEAGRTNILPIHDIREGAQGVPDPTRGRELFEYVAPVTRLSARSAPPVMGRSYDITADIEIGEEGNGVIVTHGGIFGGYALYLSNSRPVFHFNAGSDRQYRIEGNEVLSAGRHELVVRFRADQPRAGSPGSVTLLLDGRPIGAGRVEHTQSSWISTTDGFDVGHDTITAINDDYTIGTSRFSGTLNRVTVRLMPASESGASR